MEADELPSFAKRSVLVARKYAITYQPAYYRQFLQRTEALARAQYSLDRSEIKQFTKKYKVDFWLLDQQEFNPDYLTQKSWLKQTSVYPLVHATAASLKEHEVPLPKLMKMCAVWQKDELFLAST
ncbi:MAG: hypothetical protein KME16_18110 [Scytolyngbya sp. HA4215-MV1]|nr:hypothetical protein [Scytolyngbya sp. HA4215-MV1]